MEPADGVAITEGMRAAWELLDPTIREQVAGS